ncbi:CvpA family protein [Halorubrum sp. SS5]|nr:CvpA family protein [Halorubrum sp. SS5]
MTDDPPRGEPSDEEAPSDRDHTSDPPQPMTDDTDATERTATDADRTDREEPEPDRDDGSYWTEPVDSPGGVGFSTGGLRGLLDRVGLAALSLLAVVAGWGFYSQSGEAIRTWLDPAYQPIALAVFNLAVLFVALAGVAHQLRRIRATES